MSEKQEGLCTIEWADDGTRARRVVTRSNARVTGKFPSLKNGRMAHWESSLERDAFLLHEIDPSVSAYREQPAQITFLMGGKIRAHFPDLFVSTTTGGIFREVKGSDEAKDPEVVERTAVLSAMLPLQGYRYELFSETNIRAQPRLENAGFVLRYGRNAVDPVAQETIRRVFLEAGGSITWGVLSTRIFGQYSIARVCRLILDGALTVDFDNEFSENARIFWQNK